ncbi:hypothetical protein EDB80DRAFT_742968 [Ilyonectria destructans]|nr:hypothetical protein EDB80DRAFT_742968 [Ilyonectria destructans]
MQSILHKMTPTLEPVPKLQKSLDEIRRTQRVVPPLQSCPIFPLFPNRHFQKHGDNVLVVIPTDNQFKVETITQKFKKLVPSGKLHTLKLKAESKVGNQPYNEQGPIGGSNRLRSVLELLDTPEYRVRMENWKIGTVITMSIENFVQFAVDGTTIKSATDYGAIIVHNASTGQTQSTYSKGVTIDVAYVEYARTLGFDDAEKLHGKVTCGKVMAVNVAGLKHDDWHLSVAGISRYTILEDAICDMEIPIS